MKKLIAIYFFLCSYLPYQVVVDHILLFTVVWTYAKSQQQYNVLSWYILGVSHLIFTSPWSTCVCNHIQTLIWNVIHRNGKQNWVHTLKIHFYYSAYTHFFIQKLQLYTPLNLPNIKWFATNIIYKEVDSLQLWHCFTLVTVYSVIYHIIHSCSCLVCTVGYISTIISKHPTNLCSDWLKSDGMSACILNVISILSSDWLGNKSPQECIFKAHYLHMINWTVITHIPMIMCVT